MPRRDPHLVLGVPATASATAIKAAWRRLARENHPDLSAGDAVASKAATRRMAEINAAYQELLGPGRNGSAGKGGTTPGGAGSRGAWAGGASAGTADGAPAGETRNDSHRPPGPPRARTGRPVTARLDLSGTFRPRNRPRLRALIDPDISPASRRCGSRASSRSRRAPPIPPALSTDRDTAGSDVPNHPRSRLPSRCESNSASSTATRSARSRRSSRRTSTGSPARSRATRTSWPRRAYPGRPRCPGSAQATPRGTRSQRTDRINSPARRPPNFDVSEAGERARTCSKVTPRFEGPWGRGGR